MRKFLPLLNVSALLLTTAGLGLGDDKKKDPDAIGDRNVAGKVNWYSLEKEMALGKQYAQQVERAARVVDDPIISEYVNRVGQNLVRNSDAKVPFTFKILDDEIVNALTLPGGYIFINTGLILAAGNEAELAGAMAHEVAHVAARHGTRQATRGTIAQLATIPLIFWGGWAGYGVRQATSVLLPLEFLQFSQAFEREADFYGLQYLYKAGYDPTAFIDFFEKLQAQQKRKPGTFAKVFSTHPPTEDRIRLTQKNIQEILTEKPEYVVNRSEFPAIKDRLYAVNSYRKIDDKDSSRPKLRKAPGSGPIDTDGKSNEKKTGGEDRPTLKRRPDSNLGSSESASALPND